MDSITQCHFSSAITLFKKDFLTRWQLTEYKNPLKPALFVGIYNQHDLKTFNDHDGFKLVLFGGADIPNIVYLRGEFEVVMDGVTFEHHADFLSKFVKTKIRIRIAFKDYSSFKPVPLGDKIYCYQAGRTESHKRKYRYPTLRDVIEEFGEDQVIIGYQGHTIDYVRDMFYKAAFVNLQLNPLAGFTTTLEMAHMGRVSISNYGNGKVPFCLPFENSLDVINFIDAVKKENIDREHYMKIPSDFFFESSDWLNKNFWV